MSLTVAIALAFFTVFSMIGLGLTLVGIGGGFVIVFAALIYNLITWSYAIPTSTIVIILAIAIVAEILEFIVTYFGFKKHGVSHYGLIGMIVGAFLFASLFSIIPLVGTVIGFIGGAYIGAFIGEFLNTFNKQKAWIAAKATIRARGYTILTKSALAILQIVLVVKELV